MQVYIFKPTDRKMLQEYPELEDYPEFTALTNAELIFVWYFVFDRSDLDKSKSEKDWRKRAAEKAFEDKTKQEEYISGALSTEVRNAIERMKSFSPSARMRAKAITDRIMSNFETIMKKSITDYTDTGELKKFMDLQMDILKNMPDTIQQYERAYGVSIENNSKESKDRKKTYMDDIHERIEKLQPAN